MGHPRWGSWGSVLATLKSSRKYLKLPQPDDHMPDRLFRLPGRAGRRAGSRAEWPPARARSAPPAPRGGAETARGLGELREPGRRILAGVLGFLDAATPEESERLLAGAMEASARYGAMAREHGIAIDALTETFLQFRPPFLHELGRIARRRRLQTGEATALI